MSHYSAVYGGAQYQARILLEELVRRDKYDIYYVARNINPRYLPEGYRVVGVPASRYARRLGFFADYPALMKILNKISPDIIYQRGFTSYTGFAAHYARKNHARMVLHIASDLDVTPYRELKKFPNYNAPRIEKRIGEYGIRWASDLVSQTYRQQSLLGAHYGRDVCAVIRNFQPIPNEDINKVEPVKIIWVANFKRVKRPELFVRLAEELRGFKKVEFIMIGRPGDTALYGGLHRKITMIENLTYLGELPQEEVNRLIAQSHILVNTSLLEGFPNTFIQAWMRCVPIVTLGVNTDGLLDGGDLGFCGETYEEMKQHIVRLVEDGELRRKMGRGAREYALREHSISNVEKLISVIEGDG